MGKNSLIYIGLAIAAYYLYEQSTKNTQAGCLTGYTNVNGVCQPNPTTGVPPGASGQIPCGPGYVSYFNNGVQSCIAAPGTDPGTDPITEILNNL